MKSSISIRKQTGLTQLQLAQYLGITRSLLTMHEKGRRDLPTNALSKLAALEMLIQKQAVAKKMPRPHEAEQQKKVRRLLEKHAKMLEYKKELAQRKLDATQRKYAQKTLLANLVTQLQADTNLVSTDARHRAWLHMMDKETAHGIAQHGLDVQALQQLELTAIAHRYEQAKLLKKHYI